MFGRKQIIKDIQTIKDIQERISTLGIEQYKLKGQVIQLEQKTKQLECKHNFTFDCYSVGILGTCYVQHRCTDCYKVTMKQWDNVAKKGQQALKLLNLVPKDWKIKGDKK